MRQPLETKVPTPEAQGEESFVEVRRLKWGERRDIRKKFADELEVIDREPDLGKKAELNEAYDRRTYEFVLSRIVSWNWKDEEGRLLPLPKEYEELFDFREEEMIALTNIGVRLMRGTITISEEERKK